MTTGSAMEDREVLLRLFQATGGTSWKRRGGWATKDNVGDWFGVTANAEGRVVKLVLESNHLRGDLPKELGNIPTLEGLTLGNNELTGAIPKELGDLVSLKNLRLRGNKLTGDIPKEIGHLLSLEGLFLGNNELTGGIPKEVGDLVSVKWLSLERSKLTGEIPKELGDLSAVEQIDLSSNQLSGGIPKQLGGIRYLGSLRLQGNALSEVSMEFLEALRKSDGLQATLDVEDNPLLRPPQTIMEMGVDQAISWWKDIERFGEGTSNKLKMVLIGLAEAGKTTVVRNITGRTLPNTLERTVGIEITEGWKPVDGGPLEISIWDFAGQADYYASHQIFLTKGSLFLLVVDLTALLMDAARGVDNIGDPRGSVYRWLEMLHLRVPGAAVALVGTHTDAAEFEEDPGKLEKAVDRLKQLIARYREDKLKEVSKAAGAAYEIWRPNEGKDAMGGEVLINRQTLSIRAPRTLFIHNKVFRTSLNRDSTSDLVEWVCKAVTLLDCPADFHFPAVRATTPRVWIDANSAMDGLSAGDSPKRYVTWREAVQTFGYFMETKGTPISDAEEILLRAMRHREAEGGVLLMLEDDPPRLGESAGMLYLDPTWLIEVIRRLTDHNLMDATKEGALKNELEKYGLKHNPPLELDMLWAQHRSYRTSGTLDMAYLRFLWLHRQLDDGLTLDLTFDEFNGVLSTMETLLVLYRAPSAEGTNRALFVVPARLPEYGDEQVLEKADMALGDVVVRTRCSFRQSYAPPGMIGRFLAFANAHIMEARECWQHGAHLIWAPGAHDVLVYETHFVETIGGGSVAYPGLVLCVKGNTPAIRLVLGSLKVEVKRLFEDKVHGFPGLCSVVFEDTDVVHVSDLTGDLRIYLDNRFDMLNSTMRKVAGVTSGVLEQFYLAAEEQNRHPRLLILKPDNSTQPEAGVRTLPTSGSCPTVCSTGGEEGNGAAAAAEGMQHETWDKWIQALKERRKFRMSFICEHDMTEVKCGPGGNGYLIEDLPRWVKGCLPLLQVTCYALRVAVGMVSHVDLPLDELLAALVTSASTEVLGAMATSCSAPDLIEATPLHGESIGVEEKEHLQSMQKEGYAALCQFMQRMESPSSSCCGLRFQCSSCGSTQRNDCVCVSWRDEMARVRNGKGGVVWVKKTNEAAHKDKITREGERSRASPYA